MLLLLLHNSFSFNEDTVLKCSLAEILIYLVITWLLFWKLTVAPKMVKNDLKKHVLVLSKQNIAYNMPIFRVYLFLKIQECNFLL